MTIRQRHPPPQRVGEEPFPHGDPLGIVGWGWGPNTSENVHATAMQSDADFWAKGGGEESGCQATRHFSPQHAFFPSRELHHFVMTDNKKRRHMISMTDVFLDLSVTLFLLLICIRIELFCFA